jgi:hypothetical protein
MRQVRWIDGSVRDDDRPQSKARGHEQQCESSTDRRKRPSTQASFKVREWVRHGQTRTISHLPPQGVKTSYAVPARPALSG